MDQGQQTGTPDPLYNLVSVYYHALKGASDATTYQQDAQQAGNQELVQFFQQTQQAARQQADQAKSMLQKHLSQS